MRFLKIFLLIISFAVLGLGLYLFSIDIMAKQQSGTPISFEKYFHVVIIVASAVLNIMYHVKSFRFYMRKEKQQLDKKLPKIFWIGAICFSVYLLYVSGTTLYTYILFFKNNVISEAIYVVLIFLVPALLGFLEVSILKNRIKRLKAERDTKDEIGSIGNSNL